ncbi:hypothetical protein D3C85_1676540 [compost metagenome]
MLKNLRGLIPQGRRVGGGNLWKYLEFLRGNFRGQRGTIPGLRNIWNTDVLIRPMHYQSPGEVSGSKRTVTAA